MDCSSLPTLISSASPITKLSEAESASACRAALCSTASGRAKRCMVKATSGLDPLDSWCEYEVRNTVAGEPLPYPTLPLKARVPEENSDRSTENTVRMSFEPPVNPSEVAPATKATRALVATPVPVLPFETTTKGAPLRMCRIGRLAAERSVHFQSSSSPCAWRRGMLNTASHNVLSVMFRMRCVPPRMFTFSNSDGKKEGALTLTWYTP